MASASTSASWPAWVTVLTSFGDKQQHGSVSWINPFFPNLLLVHGICAGIETLTKTLWKAKQYMHIVSKEQWGRANLNAQCSVLLSIALWVILILHHGSFHVSALARHPCTCVPQETSFDKTGFLNKPEVSTSHHHRVWELYKQSESSVSPIL